MAVGIHSIVIHKLYGKGEITKLTKDNVYVAFDGKLRIFPHPDAFVKGYLSTDADIDDTVIITNLQDNKMSSAITDGNREMILDAANNIHYEKIYEAINESVGTDYTGWMKATWPNVYPDLPFRIWFLKLAETNNGVQVPAVKGCLNTISDDWNEVVFDDLRDAPNNDKHDLYPGFTLIFAKEPQGGPYIFRGAFISNKEKTKPMHHVAKRIGTKVKLIGKPAKDIIILDDFRKNWN